MEIGVRKIGLALVLAVFLADGTAQASLIGDTVDATLHVPEFFGDQNLLALPDVSTDPVSAIVGDGVEWALLSSVTGFAGDILVDLSAEELWVTFTNNTGQDLTLGTDFVLWLEDLNWLPDPGVISEVILLSAPPDTFGEFSWTDDSIHATLFGNSIISADGAMFHFQIIPRHDVPEPATIALLGMGLAGIALRRNRKTA